MLVPIILFHACMLRLVVSGMFSEISTAASAKLVPRMIMSRVCFTQSGLNFDVRHVTVQPLVIELLLLIVLTARLD